MSLSSKTIDATLMSEAKTRATHNEEILDASTRQKSLASQLGTCDGMSTEFCKSEQQKFERHPPIDEIMGLLLSSSDSSPASLVRAYEMSMNNLNDPAIATIAAFCLIQGVGCMPNPEAAVSILTRHQDEPRAKALLAERYIFGKGVGQNICSGVDLLECAERAGDLYAYLVLGDCYRLGMINLGMPDLEKAIEEYQRVLESKESHHDTNLMKCLACMRLAHISQGGAALDHLRVTATFAYPPAQYEFGRILLDEAKTDEDRQAAMVEIECAADAKYLPACLFLARGWSTYTTKANHSQSLISIFPELNLHKALKYYVYAAEQNHQELQEFMTNYRMQLKAIPTQDGFQHTVKTFLVKAENQSNANAQVNLGLCYSFGYGTEQDYKQAFEWYLRAANQGHAYAEFWVGRCYGMAEGVIQDYKQAFEWYEKAANQGNANAENSLGSCYYNGRGIKRDYDQAYEWYQKAANQGHAVAQHNLALCFKHGRGVVQDDTQAVKWLERAANQGNADAQNMLGKCYYYGRGVTQDYRQAVEWYLKAGNQGHADAQNNLGICYYYGQGVKKSTIQAARWFRKPATQGHVSANQNLRERFRRARFPCVGKDPQFSGDTQELRDSDVQILNDLAAGKQNQGASRPKHIQ